MIATIERIETLPVLENLCEQIAPRPHGKAAVLQDKFLELLAEADKTAKYTKTTKTRGDQYHTVKLGDKSRYITLECGDMELTGEVWNKSGDYVRLATIVPCKCERPFRIAVDLEALYLTVKLLAPERVDLTTDIESNKLELRCGSCISRFIGLPQIEMQEPVDAKPVTVYSKEQKAELKWIAKATAKNENRPVLRFAHAETVDGHKFIASADGFRAHISTNELHNIDGYVDVNNVGYSPDEWRFPQVSSIAETVCGPKVNLYFGDFLKTVKAASKALKAKEKFITMHFKNHVLTITGESVERGDFNAYTLYSGKVNDYMVKVNAQYLLDAMANCDGIPNPSDVNLQSIVSIQFGKDEQACFRIIAHPGRAAYIMPMLEKK